MEIRKIKTLEEEWKAFENLTVDPRADEGQRNDLKSAFYAGALVAATKAVMEVGEEGITKEERTKLAVELTEMFKDAHRHFSAIAYYCGGLGE